PFITGAESLIVAKRRRLDPKPDAGPRKPLPIELLAGVALSARGNVGVGKHAVWRNGVAAQDVEAKGLDRLHLRSGEIGIVEVVAGIMDLDADRAGIEVGLSRPAALPGMPGALRFCYDLRDPPFLVDQIVRRDLGLLAGQPIERSVGRLHTSVMQDEHVGGAAVGALVAIGR